MNTSLADFSISSLESNALPHYTKCPCLPSTTLVLEQALWQATMAIGSRVFLALLVRPNTFWFLTITIKFNCLSPFSCVYIFFFLTKWDFKSKRTWPACSRTGFHLCAWAINACRYQKLAAKAEADENSREHAANGDFRSLIGNSGWRAIPSENTDQCTNMITLAASVTI